MMHNMSRLRTAHGGVAQTWLYRYAREDKYFNYKGSRDLKNKPYYGRSTIEHMCYEKEESLEFFHNILQ